MQKFKLGQVVMTRSINDDIACNAQFSKDILKSLRRYQNCDWSDMEHKEDIESNSLAVESGDDRIFATYKTCNGKIYIITEWDRSCTTIMYPSDY